MAKNRKPNLLRHKSGRYYARAFTSGKEVWKSLKTSHYSVAEAKLAEFLKEHRERVSNGNGGFSAKMIFVLGRYLSECVATVLANRWTQKYSASANARRR